MTSIETEVSAPKTGHLIPAGVRIVPSMQDMIPIITENPYIDHAIPLLTLLSSLHRLTPPQSIAACHKHMLSSLVLYRKKLQDKDSNRACFILAAALDETTMQTEWSSSDWTGETLCSRLFKRRDSGRQFFQIIKEWLKQPAENADKLLLAYICIKTGFRGQFRYKGQDVLDSLQVSLHHLLLQQGQLSKRTLGGEATTNGFRPVRSSNFKRSLLFLTTTLVLLLLTGGAWVMVQKDSSVEALRQTASATDFPALGYRRTTPEQIHDILFPEQQKN